MRVEDVRDNAEGEVSTRGVAGYYNLDEAVNQVHSYHIQGSLRLPVRIQHQEDTSTPTHLVESAWETHSPAPTLSFISPWPPPPISLTTYNTPTSRS